MQTAVQKKRLIRHAETLLNVIKDDNFNLEVITVAPAGHDFYLVDEACVVQVMKNAVQHKCGAAACAIGYMPATFPRLCKWGNSGNIILKSDEELSNFEAAEEVFGLTEAETMFLFEPRFYPAGKRGRRDVAGRMLKFASDGKITHKALLAEIDSGIYDNGPVEDEVTSTENDCSRW